jgi:hypothetical protein
MLRWKVLSLQARHWSAKRWREDVSCKVSIRRGESIRCRINDYRASTCHISLNKREALVATSLYLTSIVHLMELLKAARRIDPTPERDARKLVDCQGG